MSKPPKAANSNPDGWIGDFPDIPEAGLLWPWMLGGVILGVLGFYLVLTPPPPRSVAIPTPLQTLLPVNMTAPSVAPGQASSQLQLGFVDSAQSSFAKAGSAFASKVEQLSAGRLRVESHPNMEVNGKKLDERSLIVKIKSGELQMGFITSSPLSGYDKALEVLDLPFLFRDQAHADKVLKGPVGAELLAGLEANGLKGLGYLELGFRLFSSDKPMPTLRDFQGKNLRVMQGVQPQLMAKALGGEPVMTPVDKIKEAIKAGYIDAADRTFTTFWDFKLYEVHKYITETRHTYSVKVILVNKAYFDNLPAVDQAALLEAARFIQDEQRVDQRAADAEVKQKCKAEGIQVFELDDAERKRWIDACKGLHGEFVKLQGKEIVEKIKAE